MSNGTIGAICGSGTGRTSLTFGKAVNALVEQKPVIIIQFLRENQENGDWSLIKRLEPELKIFRFEKMESSEKEEAHLNILNGLNFAKKVMATGECELLILDGILGLVENQIISVDEFKQILSGHGDAELILTGNMLPAGMENCVHSIERVEQIKVDNES